jgi:membrane protein YdbS with pleckstrin-like domain
MKCNQCGAESPATATFCPNCGVQLTDSGPGAGTTARVPGVQRLHGSARPAAANQPPEQELWAGSYSAKAMAGPAIGAALLTVVAIIAVVVAGGQPAVWLVLGIGALIAWAALGLSVLWNRLTVSYRLTSYRLFHEKGLLNRTRDRIEVIDIDDVTLTQGLIERMFNVGTIHILSSDESLKNENVPARDGKLAMPGIEDARAVADLIDNTRRAERNRRGVFLENV